MHWLQVCRRSWKWVPARPRVRATFALPYRISGTQKSENGNLTAGKREKIARNPGNGPRLQEAVILYSGQYAYRYEDWAWVLPLSQLWT